MTNQINQKLPENEPDHLNQNLLENEPDPIDQNLPENENFLHLINRPKIFILESSHL